MEINNPFQPFKIKASSTTGTSSITSSENLEAGSIFGNQVYSDTQVPSQNTTTIDYLDNDTQELLIKELERQLQEIQNSLDKAKKSNGWISGAWDFFKNLTGIGAGSNKVQAEIDSLKQQIQDLKDGKQDFATTYKNITDKDFTLEELDNFTSGKTSLLDSSTAGKGIYNYTEGQKMCTDVVGDIVSGIASIAVVAFGSAIGICAAPFTAGASLGLVAAGLAMGGVSGTIVKTALKASDCIGNEKEYTLDNLKYDTITGFANGLMGPLSNALGGAAGTGIMKAFGMKSLESTVVRSAASSATGEITREAAKKLSQYSIKEFFVKLFSKSVQIVVDSGLSGATDGLSRSIANGDDIETTLENTAQSTVGAIIAAPIIGGGFSLAGKTGSALGKTKAGKKIGEVLSSGFGILGEKIKKVIPDSILAHFSNTSTKISNKMLLTSAKHSVVDNLDGTYDISLGKYIVKVSKSELSEEILADTTNVKLFQYGQEVLKRSFQESVGQEISETAARDLSTSTTNDAPIETDNTAANPFGQSTLDDIAPSPFGQAPEIETRILELKGVGYADSEVTGSFIGDSYTRLARLGCTAEDLISYKNAGFTLNEACELFEAKCPIEFAKSFQSEGFDAICAALAKNNGYTLDDAIKLRELGFNDVTPLFDCGCNFETALKFKEAGIMDGSLISNVTCYCTNIDKAIALLQMGVEFNNYFDLLVDYGFTKEAEEFCRAGIKDSAIIYDFITHNREVEYAKKLVDLGITNSDTIYNIIVNNIDLDEVARYQDAGFIDIDNIIFFIKSNLNFESAAKLKKAGFANDIEIRNILVANFDLDEAIRFRGIFDDETAIYSLLKNNYTFETVNNYINKGITNQNIIFAAVMNDVSTENVAKFINEGFSEDMIAKLISGGCTLDNAIKLKNLGLITYSDFKDNEYLLKCKRFDANYFETLLKNDIESEIIEYLPYCDPNDIIRLGNGGFEHTKDVYQIIVSGCDIDSAIKLKAAGFNEVDEIIVASNIMNKSWQTNTFKENLRFLESIEKLEGKSRTRIDGYLGYSLDEVIDEINASTRHAITPIAVSKENYAKSMRGFFANNDADLEKALKEFNFEQYAKDGLPLEYSRSAFIDDINGVIAGLDNNGKRQLFRKLGIEAVESNGKITGWNGIFDLTKLSNEGTEGKVLEICNKFFFNNKITTSNPQIDDALNALITGFPEFLNIIGKEQHSGQAYSLDIHILAAYRNVLSSEEFADLPNIDKTCLKFATILHDIAKPEGIKDAAHSSISARYARDILDKSPAFSKSIKDRIYELIENHHWLQEYSEGKWSANFVGAKFRQRSDYSLEKILAAADIKAVGTSLKDSFLSRLDDAFQEPIQNAVNTVQSSGNIFYTSRILNNTRKAVVTNQGTIGFIPEQTITKNGTTYTVRVVDFNGVAQGADLSEMYGFTPGTTKENLRLFIHATNPTEKELETLYNLQNINSDSTLCVSYASLDKKATYYGKRYGVCIETDNHNIINASPINIGSGTQKGFGYLSSQATSKNIERTAIPKRISETLGLTPEEYQEFFRLFGSIVAPSQIEATKIYSIGDKKLAGLDIRKAIQEASDSIFEQTTNYVAHNEVNVYNPTISAYFAKVKSIDDVPEIILELAQKHNLPIYVLGE